MTNPAPVSTPPAPATTRPGALAAAAPPDATARKVARRRARREWRGPVGLILLSLIPALGGAARFSDLAGNPEITEANARFHAVPAPVVVHIISATLYCFLGALQFVPSLRRRRRPWHRVSGRALAPLGLAAALSGLWMTVFYPAAPGDGPLLAGIRLVFGTAMAVAIVLGVRAILRRDVAAHRAWMIRGYALGVAAGTQALVFVPLLVTGAEPGEVPQALLMGLGWVINVVVAERIISGPARRHASPARLTG